VEADQPARVPQPESGKTATSNAPKAAKLALLIECFQKDCGPAPGMRGAASPWRPRKHRAGEGGGKYFSWSMVGRHSVNL
jgi:hypothetical protein